MLDPNLLMSAQQVVAKTLAGEDIEVRFDAEVPHADLLNRVMHLRPIPDELDRDQLVHVRADCDHELAHFKWTDPDAIKDESKLVQTITNVIEDGMIERNLSKLYLGCAENLAESNRLLLAEHKEKAPALQRALIGLTQLTFGYDLPTVLDMVGEDAQEHFDTLPDDLLDDLHEIEDTYQSVEAAKRVIEAWGLDDIPPTASYAPSVHGASLDDLRKGKVRDMVWEPPERPEASEIRVYVPYTEDDRVERIQPNESVTAAHEAAFWSAVNDAAPNLRRRLLMEFRGARPVTVTGRSKGRIDQRRLHRLAYGDNRLFKRKAPGVEIDRDITLMVDLSASMLFGEEFYGWAVETREATRLYAAAQAAACFSLVLGQLKVPHEVLAWTTDTNHSCDPIPGYDRVRGLRHVIVRDHNATFASARRAFVDLAYDPSPSENIDGESLLWGAQRLAARCQRSGRRPLLVLFSDGSPLSRPENDYVLDAHFRRACERVQQAGIPLLGVGIQTDHLADYIPETLVVNNLNEFVSRFYVMLRKALRESVKIR